MSGKSSPAPAYDDAAVIERAEDITAAEIESDLVIMHIGSGYIIRLNRVARRIWDNLQTPISVGALHTQIQEQFDVSPETCSADVGALLSALESHGIVRITSPK